MWRVSSEKWSIVWFYLYFLGDTREFAWFLCGQFYISIAIEPADQLKHTFVLAYFANTLYYGLDCMASAASIALSICWYVKVCSAASKLSFVSLEWLNFNLTARFFLLLHSIHLLLLYWIETRFVCCQLWPKSIWLCRASSDGIIS